MLQINLNQVPKIGEVPLMHQPMGESQMKHERDKDPYEDAPQNE